MSIQNKANQLTEREKKLYLLGAVVFAVLLFATVILASFLSPLLLLQLRLSILGIALIYYLTLYFYFTKLNKVENVIEETVQNEEITLVNNYEIIIWFNGRELGRL